MRHFFGYIRNVLDLTALVIGLGLLLLLSACSLNKLPQANCGDGYVLHTSPAGNERCIKPGMAWDGTPRHEAD